MNVPTVTKPLFLTPAPAQGSKSAATTTTPPTSLPSKTPKPAVLRPENAIIKPNPWLKLTPSSSPRPASRKPESYSPSPSFTPSTLPLAVTTRKHQPTPTRPHTGLNADSESDSESDETLPPYRLRRSSAPTLHTYIHISRNSNNPHSTASIRSRQRQPPRRPTPPSCHPNTDDLRYDATVETSLAYVVNAKLEDLRVVSADSGVGLGRGQRRGSLQRLNGNVGEFDRSKGVNTVRVEAKGTDPGGNNHMHVYKHRYNEDGDDGQRAGRIRCMRKFL